MVNLDELSRVLFQFFSGYASWNYSVIRTSDLSVSEAHAIDILGEDGQMNMKSLAQKLGVTTGYTTVTVDKLENKDFARRESSSEDRRIYLISLTDKGQKAYDEYNHYLLKLTEQMKSVLTEEEVFQLLTILKKINSGEIF